MRFNPTLGSRPTCFSPGSRERRTLTELDKMGWIKDKSKMRTREGLRAALEECNHKKKIWDRNETLRQTNINDYCKKCGQHCEPGDMYHPRGHCLKTD